MALDGEILQSLATAAAATFEDANHATLLQQALNAVVAVRPDLDDYTRTGEYGQLVAHLTTLAEHHANSDPDTAIRLLDESASNQQTRASYLDAHTTLTRALQIAEPLNNPTTTAAILGNLGNIQQDLGRLKDAEQTMLQALAIDEAAYEPGHPDIATTLTSLGNIQQDLGRLKDAEQTMLRALAIFEAAHEPGHPPTTFPTRPDAEQ